MDIKTILIPFGVAVIAGFIHGAIGLGYGMIAMALLTSCMSYTQGAALVSFTLLMVVFQISWSLRAYIDWKLVAGPSVCMVAGKATGIVLLMQLQSEVLKTALGIFLIVYSGSQLLNVRSFRVPGTTVAGLICGFIGGLFGGVFNVSGPAASIYYQEVCGSDTKKYASCMNFTFLPAAIAGMIMHIWYGNFKKEIFGACIATMLGVAIAIRFGVMVLQRIPAERLRKITYGYIGIMGMFMCFAG